MLLLHNHYQQPGGEDQVFAAEGELLEAHGHQVVRYTMHNDRADRMSSPSLARATIWNSAVYRDLRALIRRERPRVAHFHNTFPLISPAAYYAARAEGVPVIQTLHNYRLLCPDALFFRGGGVCEDCLGKAIPWPGAVHACYRGSYPASVATAAMLTLHRAAGTWTGAVDRYIALTAFARMKFIEGGLSGDRVTVKPNFLASDPGAGEGRGGYFLFVGRLSEEKGIRTMLDAWKQHRITSPLKVVGNGPMESEVSEAAKSTRGIEHLGRQPKGRVLSMMKDARALIFPSLWYEGFPMVIVEAYAAGLPVIASDLGSMSSLVDHGRTGLRFMPADAEDLAAQVERATAYPEELRRMRAEARAEFEDSYTAQRNYRLLMEIYGEVIEHAGA